MSSRLLYVLTWISLISTPVALRAENAFFDFNTELQLAYDHILSLRLNEGQQIVDQIKISDPDNVLTYLVEDYIDFFTLFIGEEEEDFKRLERNRRKRLSKIRSGDKSSPYYLYSQAEVHLHWALIRIKFEQKFKAFGEISSAYELLTKNRERFPSFMANHKSLGVLHAALGTIPDKYKWGVKFISGMEGSIKQGCDELEEVIAYSQNHDFQFANETLVLYAFMLLHLNNDANHAYDILSNADLDIATNPLACFVKANIAMRSGHNDEAIRVLQNRPKGEQYLPFHYLDFSLGLAKLHRLDDDADIHLLSFLGNFNGRNYIKEANQKLAWHYLIHGDRAKFDFYTQECIYGGYSIIDEDKTAKKEALAGMVPHVDLLEVRMLSDGGYYLKAFELLQQIDIGFSEIQFIEYIYRKARLAQQLKRSEDAKEFYNHLLETWPFHNSYMICNSAIQLGIISENDEAYDVAIKYFELALSMDPLEYKISLHHKAKAGLIRAKGFQEG